MDATVGSSLVFLLLGSGKEPNGAPSPRHNWHADRADKTGRVATHPEVRDD
jgi:hypothetical protein